MELSVQRAGLGNLIRVLDMSRQTVDGDNGKKKKPPSITLNGIFKPKPND
jgi:hypothetical protein